MNPTWRLSRQDDILLREWDDEWIVYDDRTGDTHRLGGAAGEIVSRLKAGPMSLDDLVQGISASLQAECDDTFRNSIEDTIDRLRALNLVNPADPCPT